MSNYLIVNNLLKIIKKTLSEVKENLAYLMGSFLLSLYVFMPIVLAEQSLSYLSKTILSMVLLTLVAYVSKYLFVVLSMIVMAINSAILHIYLHWGANNIGSRFELAALSPSAEQSEYLSTYLSYVDVWVSVYVLLICIGFYFFVKKFSYTSIIIRSLSMMGLMLLLSVLFMLHKTKVIFPYYFVNKYLSPVNVEQLQSRKNYVLKRKKEMLQQEKEMPYDKVVIIMGESANKKHMSAYGYEIQTTPFLDSLARLKTSYLFDAIAPTNQTRYSVPLIFTDARVDNYNHFFKSVSLLTTLSSYGYKTFWLSNQGEIGKNENAIATISDEADVKKVFNLVYEDAKKDEVLLNYLDKLDLNNHTKELYIFHIMGSHAKYESRYNVKTALFTNPKTEIEKYDNSIHYTDLMLKKIFNKFKNNKLLFIYLSDHSEIPGFGHGFLPSYKDEYEIPLVVYSSEENERLKSLIHENKLNHFNMESFNIFTQYILGIENNQSKISRRSRVFSITPKNVIDFKSLEYHQKKSLLRVDRGNGYLEKL